MWHGKMNVLMLGYGDVGKTISKILISRGIKPVVVDVKEEIEYELEYIRANVLKESFWTFIDLKNYDALVVVLPKDLDAIFCILMAKKLNPDIMVFARCNDSSYVEKMYKAGADYVANLPLISSEIVITSIFREAIAKRMIYENLQIVVYEVKENSPVIGKKLKDISIPNCKVLGVEKDGVTYRNEDFVVTADCKIAVVGKKEDLMNFEKSI
ncbi:hypothetical protein DRO97_02905 [Archaeoglobales archaeon]|nr:MAG: hypothetical protein DRO97_02905 [Archaeoglobales archaeon]